MEFELIPLEERPDLLNPLTKIVGDAFAGERNAKKMLNETEELNGSFKKSFCFLHSGILIGHIRLIARRNEKRSLEVLSVTIAEEHRGKKHSKKMMIMAEQWASRLGYHTFLLGAKDKIPIALYQSLGYRLENGGKIDVKSFIEDEQCQEIFRFYKHIYHNSFTRATRFLLRNAIKAVDYLRKKLSLAS